MATAQQFLNVALSQRSIREYPPGSNVNKFTKWFGVTGPWCAMFQSWCFAQVGMGEIHTAWCDDLIANAKNGRWGKWVSQYGEIRPGDLAIFDWDGGFSDHVAAVQTVGANGAWKSIEGNWSDAVMEVERGRDNILGFLRPKFTGADGLSPVPAPPTGSTDYVLIQQFCLNLVRSSRGLPMIHPDGVAGPETSEATKDFQQFVNDMYAITGSSDRIAVDGIYGPQTSKRLAWWAKAVAYPKPSAMPVPTGDPLLWTGNANVGDQVRQLQAALNRVLARSLSIDGEYGPMTKAAVTDFQSNRGLAADGIYGPDTAKVLANEPLLRN